MMAFAKQHWAILLGVGIAVYLLTRDDDIQPPGINHLSVGFLRNDFAARSVFTPPNTFQGPSS